jgi:hypothetical protein
VVTIVVGQKDPPDVSRVNQRGHRGQPLLAADRRTGIDDDRLPAPDQHRVHGEVTNRWGVQPPGDQEGVLGDLVGQHVVHGWGSHGGSWE